MEYNTYLYKIILYILKHLKQSTNKIIIFSFQ
ncbi:Uncharacterised protein [Staphylococcus aureus]|nr:Uncharacterised protein [Staphylococcus aureus]CAC8150347.1 Uncharacterised protein [Staphylococcus aureus]CAC8565744.1 Uncharacterised protein [Staphylococcus aureus]CAC9344582.1 Uncharacterised protein [Staphylococcus aureus]CYB07252.1 Uncharacterised protein [Staphylococcus aureus]